MRKKFNVFQEKYAHINSMLDKGYTYEDIISDLGENHDLKVSFNTFNSYLYRQRKLLESKENDSNNNVTELVVDEHNQNDNVQNLESEVSKDDSNENNESSNDKPHRQGFKNRSTGEAFIQNLLNQKSNK